MKNKKIAFALLAVILAFNSCIGLSMDIQMNRDGSGKITLEYRISRLLSAIGALDGNEAMPVIPVGRQDWEKTVRRIPGTRLVSHSTRETARDTIISASVDFPNPEALTALLSSSGANASISRSAQSSTLNLILIRKPDENQPDVNQPDAGIDSALLELTRSAFNAYDFSISFSAAGNSTMTITDGEGNAIDTVPSGEHLLQGRTVSFSMGIMDIMDMTDGLGFNINFPGLP